MNPPEVPTGAERKGVLLATPMRDGKVHALYCAGLMGSNGLYQGWMPMAGQSDIYVARNVLANQFMASQFETVVFVDSDIGFTRQNLQDLLESDQPIVSGLYTDKTEIKVPMFRDENGAAVKLGDLPPGGMVKAKLLPGGFLKVHRSVFQAIIDAKLVPTYGQGKHSQFYNGRVYDEHLLSEDYSFSLLVDSLGIPQWVNCGIRLNHDGRQA